MENDPEEEEEYRQTVLPAGVCEGVTESAVERMGKCARMDDDDDANATCVQTTASHGEIPRKKKTRGRVKIEMEFIQNKLRRYTTFSKRKSGIMKKV
jgi:serum response factor